METAVSRLDYASQRGKESSPRSEAMTLLTSDFESFYSKVYGYLLHRFFDPELAAELTSETFFKATTSIRKVEPDAARIQKWLLRTATNLANMHYRRARVRLKHLPLVARFYQATSPPEPTFDSPGRDRVEDVRRAIVALRPKYQAVVVMRYYVQMSFADIAAVLGCREVTARSRLSRALKQMGQRLGPRVCEDCRTPVQGD